MPEAEREQASIGNSARPPAVSVKIGHAPSGVSSRHCLNALQPYARLPAAADGLLVPRDLQTGMPLTG